MINKPPQRSRSRVELMRLLHAVCDYYEHSVMARHEAVCAAKQHPSNAFRCYRAIANSLGIA